MSSRMHKNLPDSAWYFYQKMYLIRRTEEVLLDCYSKGALFGTLHTSIGQESCAVGVIEAIDSSQDTIWSNHRGHGHFLAYTDDPEGLIAEVMGKVSGVCGGLGGTQHLHKNRFFSNGILGGTVPCALGTALASKLKQEQSITTVFFGDGALGEGVVYESFNIASLWKLPVLFVLEDNQYAQSTHFSLEHAGNLYERARAFDIESTEVTTNDVFDIQTAAKNAVTHIRSNIAPFFLILKTYRLMPHSTGDEVRSPGEIAKKKQDDYLMKLRCELDGEDADRVRVMEGNINARIAKAVDAAVNDSCMSVDGFLNRT